MEYPLLDLNHIGNAIGWSLIHFLWQGLLLFISYWLITRILLKNKIHLQYWVGIIFILMCLIVPCRELLIQLGTNDNISIIQQLSISTGIIESSGILSNKDMFIAVVQQFIPYLVLIWFFSVVLISLHLAKSWFSLLKLAKNSSTEIPNNLQNKLKIYTERLKLKFKPVISINIKIDIPATFGFFKPIVLLPASLINHMPQDQMEAILLHEMCHIKRSDFLHNILQLLVETLFFYHPLTKWISKDVRKVREQCCDELVLKLNTDPLIYAKALTNIASIYNTQSLNKMSPKIQIAANDGELLNRIKFLMLEKAPKEPIINIGFGLVLSVIILFLFSNLVKNNNTPYQLGIEDTINHDNDKANSATVKPNYIIPNIKNLIVKNQAPIIVSKKDEPVKKYMTSKVAKLNESKTIQLSTSIDSTIIENKQPVTVVENDNTQQVVGSSTIQSRVDDKPIEVKEVTHAEGPQLLKNTFPKLVKKVNPVYNSNVRRSGIQGSVILSFNIDEKGRVIKIKIDKSSPKKILDSSAKKALRKWRFDENSITESNISKRYQQIFSYVIDDSVNQCGKATTGTRIARNPTCQ